MSSWPAPRNPKIRHVSRLNRTRTKCPAGPSGHTVPPFLWRTETESGLKIPGGRMQCDHKPIIRRMLLDFVEPVFVDSLLCHRANSSLRAHNSSCFRDHRSQVRSLSAGNQGREPRVPATSFGTKYADITVLRFFGARLLGRVGDSVGSANTTFSMLKPPGE